MTDFTVVTGSVHTDADFENYIKESKEQEELHGLAEVELYDMYSVLRLELLKIFNCGKVIEKNGLKHTILDIL